MFSLWWTWTAHWHSIPAAIYAQRLLPRSEKEHKQRFLHDDVHAQSLLIKDQRVHVLLWLNMDSPERTLGLARVPCGPPHFAIPVQPWRWLARWTMYTGFCSSTDFSFIFVSSVFCPARLKLGNFLVCQLVVLCCSPPCLCIVWQETRLCLNMWILLLISLYTHQEWYKWHKKDELS